MLQFSAADEQNQLKYTVRQNTSKARVDEKELHGRAGD